MDTKEQKKKSGKIIEALVLSVVADAISLSLMAGRMQASLGMGCVWIAIVVSLPVGAGIFLLNCKAEKVMWNQLLLVAGLGALPILATAAVRPSRMEFETKAIALLMYLLLFVFWNMLALQAVRLYRQHKMHNVRLEEGCKEQQEEGLKASRFKCMGRQLCGWLNSNRAILLTLLLVLLVRLPYLEILPRWDSGEYYYKFSSLTEQFRFGSLYEFFKDFRLCGHPTLAFCYVYFAGEVLFPKQVIGVSLVSVILTAAAMWCVYKIQLKMLPKLPPARAALYTFAVSMLPLVFSTATYFNPDYALAMFFIYALYGCICDRPVIAGIAAMMCMQTKETGLVLVGGLAIGVVAGHVVRHQWSWYRKAFCDIKLYLIGFFCVLQFFYMKAIGGVSSWGSMNTNSPAFSWDGTGYNCFGINRGFFTKKFCQQFVLNFNWLVAVILIFFAVRYVVLWNRVRIRKPVITKVHITKTEENLLCIAVPFFCFFVFSALYITASHARYNVIGDILLCMAAFYFLGRASLEPAVQKHRLKRLLSVVPVCLLLLFAIQSLRTIDPLTRLCFWKLDAGNTSIYHVGDILDKSLIYYGDGLIYNTQYQYLDKAYDRLLKEADYAPESTDIILPTPNGCFIAGNVPMYYLNWDEKRSRRVFYENENTKKMRMYYLTCQLGTIAFDDLKEQAILVVNPFWMQVDMDEEMAVTGCWYEIGAKQVVETPQGSVIYYRLTKKKQNEPQ